jgi:hypothetical protein
MSLIPLSKIHLLPDAIMLIFDRCQIADRNMFPRLELPIISAPLVGTGPKTSRRCPLPQLGFEPETYTVAYQPITPGQKPHISVRERSRNGFQIMACQHGTMINLLAYNRCSTTTRIWS